MGSLVKKIPGQSLAREKAPVEFRGSELMDSQKVDFCHSEEQIDEKSLNYFRDFSLRSK